MCYKASKTLHHKKNKDTKSVRVEAPLAGSAGTRRSEVTHGRTAARGRCHLRRWQGASIAASISGDIRTPGMLGASWPPSPGGAWRRGAPCAGAEWLGAAGIPPNGWRRRHAEAGGRPRCWNGEGQRNLARGRGRDGDGAGKSWRSWVSMAAVRRRSQAAEIRWRGSTGGSAEGRRRR